MLGGVVSGVRASERNGYARVLSGVEADEDVDVPVVVMVVVVLVVVAVVVRCCRKVA